MQSQLYFTYSVNFISDLGISVPPLDWESPIDFDAPAPPRGYYSWAATVQAEMGDPRPLTRKEMKKRLDLNALQFVLSIQNYTQSPSKVAYYLHMAGNREPPPSSVIT